MYHTAETSATLNTSIIPLRRRRHWRTRWVGRPSKHVVTTVGEFLVPIANQEAERFWAFGHRPCQLPGLLCYPRRARIRRTARDVHTTAPQFDEEEHVQSLQPDRLDREEIDREHAAPMRSHELAPGHPAARAGGSETHCPKPCAHRRRRDHQAKAVLFHISADSLITPHTRSNSAILPGARVPVISGCRVLGDSVRDASAPQTP
jgi:hypothetical protein